MSWFLESSNCLRWCDSQTLVHQNHLEGCNNKLLGPAPRFSVSWGLGWSSRDCIWGLPWWRSGWESACQCRGHGFEPWSGRIPHATEQLSPWATTTEPVRLEPVLHKKRVRDSERPTQRDEEWPPLATLGKALAQKWRPNTAKNKLKKKNSTYHLIFVYLIYKVDNFILFMQMGNLSLGNICWVT